MIVFQRLCTVIATLPEESFEYEDDKRLLTCRGLDRFAVDGGHDGAFFVRLHSRSEAGRHPILESLRGKRVRVTVEVEEGESPSAEDPMGSWPRSLSRTGCSVGRRSRLPHGDMRCLVVSDYPMDFRSAAMKS